MTFNKKLYIQAVVLVLLSIVFYVIAYVGVINRGFHWMFFVGLILMVAHQAAAWYILYRFAVTRQRMRNKLHFLNRVSLGVTFGFAFLYLIMSAISGSVLIETNRPLITTVVMVLMAVDIVYQENNTHNFIRVDLTQKISFSKKTLNQYIGIFTTWILINLLWIPFSAHQGLSVFAFLYVFLLLTQNSLSYTTFGQSRYWNFTYECIWIIQLYVVGLQSGLIVVQIIAGLLGLVFLWRQWQEMGYHMYSRWIGILLFILMNVFMVYKNIQATYIGAYSSYLLIYPAAMIMISFILAFLIDRPDFYRKLLRQ